MKFGPASPADAIGGAVAIMAEITAELRLSKETAKVQAA